MITNKAKELHFSSLVFDTHSDSLGRSVDEILIINNVK